MKCLRIGILCLGMGVLPAISAEQSGSDVTLKLDDVSSREYVVEGHIYVRSPRPVVWQVLTDYEQMPKFLSSMHTSQIQKRDQNSILLKQVATTKLFLFSRTIHVMLAVQETPLEKLVFEDVLQKDFELYQGSWEILDSPEHGLDVTYRLHATRKFAVPNFLAKKAMRGGVHDLLEEVRTQILKQTDLAPSVPAH